MKQLSFDKQPLIINEQDTIVINFDEAEVLVRDHQTDKDVKAYTYETIRINRSEYNYGGIVSAVVRSHYSSDNVEAIVLNGIDTEEHASEYEALQAWRAHAKEVARSIIGKD